MEDVTAHGGGKHYNEMMIKVPSNTNQSMNLRTLLSGSNELSDLAYLWIGLFLKEMVTY